MPSRARTADVLGLPLHRLSAPDVWGMVDEALIGKSATPCLHIVTLNPEYVMTARQDPEFAAAINRAGLITADGIGVAMATRLNSQGQPKVERVTGVDILRHLAAHSRDDDAPLFMLGAGPGVAAEAALALETQFPESRIYGWWSEGTAEPESDGEALRRIRACDARAVAVAYGGRGQVLWIDRNLDELAAAGVRVAVGVGGAFDFVAGRVPRAPGFVQRAGFEWLFRLAREPWRWRRQLVLPQFTALVVKERLASARRRT
ncbi:MAG: WecB/TagA/CpsF family glycosyltransferase [Thermomicrobiales bacterium]